MICFFFCFQDNKITWVTILAVIAAIQVNCSTFVLQRLERQIMILYKSHSCLHSSFLFLFDILSGKKNAFQTVFEITNLPHNFSTSTNFLAHSCFQFIISILFLSFYRKKKCFKYFRSYKFSSQFINFASFGMEDK